MIRKIEISKLLQTLLIASPLVNISDGCNSNLQLHLADGSQKRVTMKLNLTDFTVKSILKVIKRVLPAQTYISLWQDIVTLFTGAGADNFVSKSYIQD